MSALCVQRSGRIADYFLIYLQAAERIEWLKPAQYLSAWMCVHARANPIWEEGLCIWEPFVCAPLSVFACICVCVSNSCLGFAALWQCHRRGVLVCEPVRPQPPSPHHNMGDSHRPHPLLCILFYLLLYSALQSCSTLGISFLGNTALKETTQ